MHIGAIACDPLQNGQALFLHETTDKYRDGGIDRQSMAKSDAGSVPCLVRMKDRRVHTVIKEYRRQSRRFAQQFTSNLVADEDQPIGRVKHWPRDEVIGKLHQALHSGIRKWYCGNVLDQHDWFTPKLGNKHCDNRSEVKSIVNDYGIAGTNCTR